MNDTAETQNVPSQPDVVVIGGGLAGLTAAAVVAKAGRSVVVHEKLSVLGGDARSVDKDGFIFNQGPHALYKGGRAEQVLADLGVTVKGGQPPIKGGLVFDGKVEIAPAGAPTLLRTKALDLKGKVEIGKNLALLPRLKADKYNDVTVADWIGDLVSGERPAEMLRSLVRLATYANQPDQLSADVAITQLQSALGPGVLYLDGGWQSLVDQLATTAGVHVVAGEAIAELPDAPAVIIAAGGASTAARLLDKTFDVGPPAGASCLDLGLSRRPEMDFIIGGDEPFYFSNHSSVAALAPTGQFQAGAIQYLAEGDEPDADAIMNFARKAGVRDADVMVSRRLHKMTTVSAIPTASRGGLASRPKVTDTGHDNVFLAGDWVGPEGHLADAAVASADAAAKAALAVLEQRVSV